VYQHTLSPLMPGDAAPAIYRRTLNGVIYRDDGAPQFVKAGRVETVNIAIKENDFVEMTHDLMFEHFTESGSPVAAAANNVAFTGFAMPRGVRRDPDEAVLPVYVRVTVTGALDGSLPHPQIKAKIGGVVPTDAGFAAEFTGPAIVVDGVDSFVDLLEGALGVPIGPSFNNPFQVAFHTATPADILTVGDAWTIPARIPVISPTYTSREVYDHGQAVALIDGKKYIWHNVAIKGTKAQVEDRGIGSYFVQQILDTGEWMWEVTLERNYTDRNFEAAIRAGRVSAFIVTLTGDRIGASLFRDQYQLILASTQYDEAGSNVANQGVLGERIVMKAFDNKVDPIAQEIFVNTIPTGVI
jgi:hypothetical protein